MDLNRVTLIGNLAGDPRAKTSPSGKAIAEFSLATSHRWQDSDTKVERQSVEFHDVLAFGKLAEIIRQYLKIGSKVYVEGHLRTSTWQDSFGKSRTTTEVIADNLILLGRRSTPRVEEVA